MVLQLKIDGKLFRLKDSKRPRDRKTERHRSRDREAPS
jgi:hypothetical protein